MQKKRPVLDMTLVTLQNHHLALNLMVICHTLLAVWGRA